MKTDSHSLAMCWDKAKTKTKTLIHVGSPTNGTGWGSHDMEMQSVLPAALGGIHQSMMDSPKKWLVAWMFYFYFFYFQHELAA